MYRKELEYLKEWKHKARRKPLILRGARQVGKTELVRMCAAAEFENLVEINFDETPGKAGLFHGGDVHEIIRLIEVDLDVKIETGKSLLFLDEIQAVPKVLKILRYFYEKLPTLHVIAAGSLLDFMLSREKISVPVGRVEYMFLGPMSFEEYLLAGGEERLSAFISDYELTNFIPSSIHEKLQKLVREYLLIGGMPGVIAAYLETGKNFSVVAEEHQGIIQTYYDDFGKYRDKVNVNLLQQIYRRLPGFIGKNIKYTNLADGTKVGPVKDCLSLLEKARIVSRVVHSDGNGLPLAAEQKLSKFKILYLDVGLLNSFLGLKISDFYLEGDYITVHSGAIAEQFVGQHLQYQRPPYEEPFLFYWNRMKKGSTSEVDYLFENKRRILPVEVKAGATGRLKSLHVFISEKAGSTGIRFNSDLPSLVDTNTVIPGREKRPFTLLSLPLYLVGQLPRLLDNLET